MAPSPKAKVIPVLSRMSAEDSLQTIGLSEKGVIILDPGHADLSTAAGLALLAHEAVHQDQYENITDFDTVYELEDRHVPADRPYENKYEYPAYMKERQVYCDLVKQGYPRGNWVPLMVQVMGCPVSYTTRSRISATVGYVT
jgi:hypothetical protein